MNLVVLVFQGLTEVFILVAVLSILQLIHRKLSLDLWLSNWSSDVWGESGERGGYNVFS